jgi:hypothetical protein
MSTASLASAIILSLVFVACSSGGSTEVGPSDGGVSSSDALAADEGAGSGVDAVADDAAASDALAPPDAFAPDDGGNPDAEPLPHDAGPSGDGGCAGVDGSCPLSDMGLARYLGMFGGGLYQDGLDEPPAAHATEGLLRAMAITPRDVQGNPSPSGKIVLLSIGMSNTAGEFCVRPGWGSSPPNEFVCNGNFPACTSGTFMDQAANDPDVNHATLEIVNGAFDGQTAEAWTVGAPGLDPHMQRNYQRVRECILVPKGLSELQVQVVWLKVANPNPTVSLPDPMADAYALERFIGRILRAAKVVYPNLQMVLLSSRIYGGYANLTMHPLNPEPYAYESGFSVKWAIQAQVDQRANGGAVADPIAGDVDYATGMVPWIAWGPYLWANGLTPRSDGLTWTFDDFANDQTHPSVPKGVSKVGALLHIFFKTSRFTRCWYLANGGACT